MEKERQEEMAELLSPELESKIAQSEDTEIVLKLIEHIENPCKTKLPSGKEVNIRDFYLRVAEELLPKLKNPGAKKMLEEEINRWRKEEK